MTRMILKRLGQGLLVLLVLETVTFFLIRLLPGHPFMGEKKLPEHVLQQLQASYGLDQPSLVQYGRYWWNMLAHGDLGPSLVKEGVSVADMIGQSFPSAWRHRHGYFHSGGDSRRNRGGSVQEPVDGLVGDAGFHGRHLHSRLCRGSGAGRGLGHACARLECGRMGFPRLRSAPGFDAGSGECRISGAPDARRHA